MDTDAPEKAGAEEIDVRGVLRAGIVLALVMVVVAAGLVWLMRSFAAGAAARDVLRSPLALPESGRVPPRPQLQVQPFDDVEDLRAAEAAILESYGRDPATQAVRIPIERAMERVVEQGLPAWGTPPPPVAVPTPRPAKAQATRVRP